VKVAFAGTAPLAADVLERLAGTQPVEYLLTRPDAPRGRGRAPGPPPAKVAAERLGIPVRQPEQPQLGEPVDRVVVCAYGLYIRRCFRAGAAPLRSSRRSSPATRRRA
jgi:methionyl-tRNA formyltransferase